VIKFAKKTWIFLLTAAAVAVSAVILSVAINKVWYFDEQIAVTDYDMRQPKITDSNTDSGKEPFELWAVQPDYLLLDGFAENEAAESMPDVLSSKEAADSAAKHLMQFFEADLDGEVCRAYFMGSDQGGTAVWYITFGSHIANTYYWNVTIDANDGSLIDANQSFYIVESMPGEDSTITPEEFDGIREDYLRQAEALTKRFIDEDVEHVEEEPFYEGDGDYYLSMPVAVRVLYGDGGIAEYYFETLFGGLTSVRVYRQADVGTAVEMSDAVNVQAEALEPTATPMPVPSSAEY